MTTCPKKNTYDYQHWLGSCCIEFFFWVSIDLYFKQRNYVAFLLVTLYYALMVLMIIFVCAESHTHWIFEFFDCIFFQRKSVPWGTSFKLNSQTILFQLNWNETKRLQINSFYWIPSWTMTIFFIITLFLQVCKRILKFLAKF